MAYTTAASAGGKNLNLKDFLLSWAPRRRQSAQEQLGIFRALAAAFKERD